MPDTPVRSRPAPAQRATDGLERRVGVRGATLPAPTADVGVGRVTGLRYQDVRPPVITPATVRAQSAALRWVVSTVRS